MKVYQSELMRVTNNDTNKTTYYVKKCDTFQRVSREDYDMRCIRSDGYSCAYTKQTRKHMRHYITAIYEVNA